MVSLQELLDEGVLIDPDVDKSLLDEKILNSIMKQQGDDLLIITNEIVDAAKNFTEKKSSPENKVKVLWSYEEPSVKRTYDHFVKSLQMRFKAIEKLLKARQELLTITSIIRIKGKSEKEAVACIGMVIEKAETTNNNIMITIEDFSGSIKVLVTQKKKELYDLAKDIQLDEVLGFTGNTGKDIIFPDTIIFPDVPLTKELKKSPLDEYAIFVGDPHFGSSVFLKDDFTRMLLWLTGKVGNDEQRSIAKKVKYVFITGDLIEGVGVYPGQEKDLAIIDIRDQYKEAANYLKQIPEHMHIILFTGNHDAGRISEPQEPVMKEYAQCLYDLPNITIVSNPAMVNIGATKDFPGFDCLLYHGGSFIYYADAIPSIRSAGGQKKVDMVMKYLLQRRHLAPTHNAALTIPTTDRDWLFMDVVPDIFISGHIHRVSFTHYRNVTCVNAGCWTETTDDQVKRGLEPQPSKLILLSLKTRKGKLMNFKKEHDEKSEQITD
jgi:DNA polymerase II small subunit